MTLQDLYDSEINFKISTLWDAGFDWWLGDFMNGFTANGNADTYAQACEQLFEAAVRHWPDSEFARKRAARVVPS